MSKPRFPLHVLECEIQELVTNMKLVILPSFRGVRYVLKILVISHRNYVKLNNNCQKLCTKRTLHTHRVKTCPITFDFYHNLILTCEDRINLIAYLQSKIIIDFKTS